MLAGNSRRHLANIGSNLTAVHRNIRLWDSFWFIVDNIKMFYACYALQKNFCYKLFWHEQEKCINLYRLMAKILIVHSQFLRQTNNKYRPHPLSPQPANTDVTHKKNQWKIRWLLPCSQGLSGWGWKGEERKPNVVLQLFLLTKTSQGQFFLLGSCQTPSFFKTNRLSNSRFSLAGRTFKSF